MALIRVRGQHFDVGGESTLEELLRMDGLFPLKDIQKRLPFSKKRLAKLVHDQGDLSSCFTYLYKDRRNKGVLHVDLLRLNEMLLAQAQEAVRWRAKGMPPVPSACLTCKHVGGL